MNRYDEYEMNELMDVIKSGNLGTAKCSGVKTKEFEALFAQKINAKYAVAVSSATAGLHMALLAVGVRQGDEVIVDPLFKFGAVTAIHANAIPVFADVEKETFMPSLEMIKKCVTQKTKAIIYTNIFGCTGNITEIQKFCDERGIYLIEDCAHSILATCDGKKAGTIGKVGVFSFQNTKHLSMGDGGMVVTDDLILYYNLLALREHGYRKEEYEDLYKSSRDVGWMYRITELQSAVGLAQLRKLDRIITYHKKIGQMFTQRFAYNGLDPQINRYGEHVYWKWVALCRDPKLFQYMRNHFREEKLIKFGHNQGRVVYQSRSLGKVIYNIYEENGTGALFESGSVLTAICPNAEEIVKFMIIIEVDIRYDIEQYHGLAERLEECIDFIKQ